jgi:hypothetical protein
MPLTILSEQFLRYAPCPMRHASFPALPDPPGSRVAGRPDQEILGEFPKKEIHFPALNGFSLDWILYEKYEENLK